MANAIGEAGGAARRNAGTGIALMAAGTLMIPGMDAVAKALGSYDPTMPATQIAFFRFLAQGALLLPLAVALGGWASLRPERPVLTALRGLLIAAASLFFFSALRVLPMAETVAIFFVEPLLLTLLSALILRERLGWRRLSAVAIGLFGAMLIVQPTFASVGWAALLPLGAALCFAFYLLLTKMLAEQNAMALQFWAAVSGGLALIVAMAFGEALSAAGLGAGWAQALRPIAPAPWQWGLLALLGVIATVAHFLIVLAFRHAPASQLAPLQYLEIVSATLLGWAFFNAFPDPATSSGQLTWAGVALIVGAGLFVARRERRLAVQPRPEDSR